MYESWGIGAGGVGVAQPSRYGRVWPQLTWVLNWPIALRTTILRLLYCLEKILKGTGSVGFPFFLLLPVGLGDPGSHMMQGNEACSPPAAFLGPWAQSWTLLILLWALLAWTLDWVCQALWQVFLLLYFLWPPPQNYKTVLLWFPLFRRGIRVQRS